MTLVLTAVTSAVFVLAMMPWLIRYLRKRAFGQTIYELGPQAHLQKQGTPNMGGILIASVSVLTALAYALYEGVTWQLLPLVLASLGAMGVGFADDYIKVIRRNHEGLKPRQKIIGQVLVGLFFSIYCYFFVGSSIQLPFTRSAWDLGILYVPLMTLLFIFMTNSANLQDGVDGLMGSVTVVGAVAMAVIAVFLDHQLAPRAGSAAAGLLMAVAGASIGFLRYNKHPAQIMMGDTGSMYIGGVFTAVSMLLGLQFWLIPICFTMIMSSVSVIMQRSYYKLTHGKRIFKMSPIHHHFELSGMNENQIVIMYALVTLAMSAIAVLAAMPLFG